MDNFISIFIPVYQEEKIIEKNILKILKKINEIEKKFEIIIVDDNSMDKTPIICKKLSSHPQIRWIRYNNGPSRRENLGISFKKAKGNIIAFMDMDLATDINYTEKLFNYIKNGADICTGSRNMPGSYMERSVSRKVISSFYNIVMKSLFNSKIKDHQCGFKAFKRNIIIKLIKDMGYDKKFKRGWFWDAELLIRAQKKKYKIVEFPIKWKHGEKSEFRIKRELRMIPYILKLSRELK